MALGFYINNQNCYGCKTCSMACLTTNTPESDSTFMRNVHTVLKDDKLAYSFVSLACNHCEDPACLKNCPVNAYTKLENGIVKQDHSKCIGCKTCITACPYGAPVFNEEDKTTYKCDMCYDRIERGEDPACVHACPGANIEFGELEDLKKKHPEAVNAIDDVLPSPDETHPSLLVNVDPDLLA